MEYLRIFNEYGNNGLSELEVVMVASSGGGIWHLCWKDVDFQLAWNERIFAYWDFATAMKSFDWTGKNDKFFKVQNINPEYLKRRMRIFLRGYGG